ncbi:MAG: glycosyltransferase family 2 protein [Pseudomonadota bacterium]
MEQVVGQSDTGDEQLRAEPENLPLRLGIVAIGRNEGERLMACLRSMPSNVPVVYVDSGSTDGSAEKAAQLTDAVVELDMRIPFSAGRARKEGFEKLIHLYPDLDAVHFFDGDTMVEAGWLRAATEFLQGNPNFAAVAGRRRERFPEASWYNRMCDSEWDTPVGEANAVGGDALYRRSAFEAAEGFDPNFVCGEEPELCFRLRQAGHKVMRLGHDMTLHDAAITTFSGYWKRAVRSGYAWTLGALKHGKSGYNVKEALRAALWGAGLPILALGLLVFGFGFAALLVIALYPIKFIRLRSRFRNAGEAQAGRRAATLMLVNAAEARGLQKALFAAWRGEHKILEYKSS